MLDMRNVLMNNSINRGSRGNSRSLNFELLRVLSILSIVTGHLGEIGPAVSNPLCMLGDVNCFVLISGYFLINGRFKSQRFIRLLIETIFYCFVITVGFAIFDPNVGIGDFAKSLFPLGPHRYSYWFINKFLALMLLQPFISRMVTALSKRQYQVLLGAMYMINSELVMGFPFSCIFDNGWSLPWMITVFLTGGYIRLYNPFEGFRHWGAAWLAAVCVFYIAGRWGGAIFNIQYNQWFFMAKSLTMFMWIRSITIAPESFVGKITAFFAPNVLAVYLIHNQALMIAWLKNVGNNLTIGYPDPLMFAIWCLFSIGVIIACTLTDKCRVKAFEVCEISKAINRLSTRIGNHLNLN